LLLWVVSVVSLEGWMSVMSVELGHVSLRAGDIAGSELRRPSAAA